MRILITGSREWHHSQIMVRAVAEALREANIPDGTSTEAFTIVHGGARGADMMADGLFRALGFNIESYPANWAEHGKAAGPIRNQQMVDSGADVCLAFLTPGSKGTADCVRRAKKAGIPVKEYHNES